MSEWWLVPAAFLTSGITAVAGLGGGMVLIALMPGLIPAPLIIPVHGAVQLASNISRAAFAFKSIYWLYVRAFVVGALAGAAIAWLIADNINLDLIPLFIAAYMLINVWQLRMPWPGLASFSLSKTREITLAGAIVMVVTMLVGVGGPLGNSVLMRHQLERETLVATSAMFMTIGHGLKVVVFFLLGVSLVNWLPLIGAMITASIAGSWVGTRLRFRIDQQRFRQILKWLLTLLAVRMVWQVMVSWQG